MLAVLVLFAALSVCSGSADAAVPVPVVSPKTLSFGNQSWKTTSATKSVTLKNNTKTTIASMTIVASSGFTITSIGTCNAPLLSHTSCIFTVAFEPTSVEAYVGTVAITALGAHKPGLVKLSGTGTAVVGQPAGHVLVAGGVNSSVILATAEPLRSNHQVVFDGWYDE